MSSTGTVKAFQMPAQQALTRRSCRPGSCRALAFSSMGSQGALVAGVRYAQVKAAARNMSFDTLLLTRLPIIHHAGRVLIVAAAGDMVSVVIRQSLAQLDTPDAMRCPGRSLGWCSAGWARCSSPGCGSGCSHRSRTGTH